MKENKFKYLLGVIATLCMVFVLMPTAALANGPEVYDGDIYVRDGKYTIINGSGEEPVFYDVDKDNPIKGTGEPINRNIYVRDETELYFDDLDLGTGGIYVDTEIEEFLEIHIENGSVRAKEINASYIEIGSGASVYVKENVTGARFHSYGGTINVDGNIMVTYIWLREGNTVANVGGNIDCKYFINEGSLVRIDGNLTASTNEPNDSENFQCYISIEGDVENKKPAELYVGGEISAKELIEIYYSNVYANSIKCDNDFIAIHDSATLFNAINKNPDVIPSNFSEPPLNLYRTTLSGLIPNREANIVISYDDHDDYTKEFTATANAEGQVFVWLVGNKNLSGTVTYDGAEPVTLTAEASVSSGVVENLEFPYELDNGTSTSESNESSSTEGNSNVSTSDTETKKDDSDNTQKTTDSAKTIKADTPKTSDNNSMALWFILSVTTLFVIAGLIIEKRKINGQKSK